MAAIPTGIDRPAPGSAGRQAIVDRLADINAELADLAQTVTHQRLSTNDPLYVLAVQLLQNSGHVLALAASFLAAEQMCRR